MAAPIMTRKSVAITPVITGVDSYYGTILANTSRQFNIEVNSCAGSGYESIDTVRLPSAASTFLCTESFLLNVYVYAYGFGFEVWVDECVSNSLSSPNVPLWHRVRTDAVGYVTLYRLVGLKISQAAARVSIVNGSVSAANVECGIKVTTL